MSATMTAQQIDRALSQLDAAATAVLLCPAAAANIRRWLTLERYRTAAPQVAEHLEGQRWSTLNDLFWRELPFGTAGRRGRMFPIGSDAINEYTIGETAQGLADYVRSLTPEPGELRCAVAYDTRHRSREFAELCCGVMAAAGFLVYFFDDFRGTPELGFAVRALDCDCGIMISASHNPPSDNAIKIFWRGGAQLRPPHDTGVKRYAEAADSVGSCSLDDARRQGRVVSVQPEMDRRFSEAVLAQSFPGPRDIKILYSPLHGVGATCLPGILRADGFKHIEIYARQAAPDGDFPNVPNHVANPENPLVFDSLIGAADEIGADLVLASDPDADRIGCAARLTHDGAWRVLTGNQIAVLLADFILRRRSAASSLSADHFIVKTLVTTEMLRAVADRHGVQTYGNVLTGFKWICGAIDELGPERFVFGAEEAHGYLVGDYIRDKDATGAAMLLAELAAEAKQNGHTLHDVLNRLYGEVGYFAELTISRSFPGTAGLDAMQAAMHRLRNEPTATLGGMRLERLRDYLNDTSIRPKLQGETVQGSECDLLFFDLERPGNAIAVRPSGTEPKLKFYLFAHRPPSGSEAIDTMRIEVDEQLSRMQADVLAAAGLSK